mmetsp:Transcript_21805/g.30559  ORF Transcript_21805/g.30559 Transcript_21805/m.30559 type:complete len:172 (-) Transcript_21805:13-528(-)
MRSTIAFTLCKGSILKCHLRSLSSKTNTTTSGGNLLRKVALSGSGWLLPFHVGACQSLRDMGYVNRNTEYAGASGGALVATALCCGFNSDEIMKNVLELAEWYRSQDIGLGILETEMRQRFLALLPEEAWSIVGNKLHIAILPLDPRKMFQAELVTNFESKEDMVEALVHG